MRFLYRLLGGLLLLSIIGSCVFLFTWDIPPPSAKTEKVIANERFSK